MSSPNGSPNATVGSVHQNRPMGHGAIPGKPSAQQVKQSQQQTTSAKSGGAKRPPAQPTKKGKR